MFLTAGKICTDLGIRLRHFGSRNSCFVIRRDVEQLIPMGKRAAPVAALGRVERRPGKFRAKAELDRDTTCRGPWRDSEAEADNDLRRAREGHNRSEFHAILETIMRETTSSPQTALSQPSSSSGSGGAHPAVLKRPCSSSGSGDAHKWWLGHYPSEMRREALEQAQ